MPGYHFSFPRDHAAHPEFKTEWWYFTGHLAEKGKTEPSLGYELTFFRTALTAKPVTTNSNWSLRDIHFAHVAISDLKQGNFWFAEKISRGALGLAGAETSKLHSWIEDWSLTEAKDGVWNLHAKADGRSIDLQLQPAKPVVIHGEDGVSRKAKGEGHATHYVSFTRMKTSGRVTLPDRILEVSGESWHDHEFGTNQLTSDQAGWDWFSLQFDSGEELMIYLLRKKNGCFEEASSGTWVDSKGAATHLTIGEISVLSRDAWKSGKSGAVYPSRWEIRIPGRGVNVVVEPLLADQELRVKESSTMAYWEGSCRVTGSHTGRAYVELTGYEK